MKLLKKDIWSDVNRIGWTFSQIRSDRSQIQIIFIRYKSYYFSSYSNQI